MVQMSYINKVKNNDKVVWDENKIQSIIQLEYTTPSGYCYKQQQKN